MIKCDDTFREVMPKEMLYLSFMFLLVLSSMAVGSWGQGFLCSTWNPQGPVRCCMLLKSLWKEVKRGRKKEGVMKSRKGRDGRNWRTKGKEREKRTEKRIVIPECLWEISACLFKCLMLELLKITKNWSLNCY